MFCEKEKDMSLDLLPLVSMTEMLLRTALENTMKEILLSLIEAFISLARKCLL